MIIRNRFSERVRVGFQTEGKTRTLQHCKEQCDINNILAKYKKTGILPVGRTGMPQFGDFANIEDYQNNMNRLLAAQEAFDSLPASIRKRFGNDPANLVDFCSDESNYDEAVKIGLAKKREPVENVVNEPPKDNNIPV